LFSNTFGQRATLLAQSHFQWGWNIQMDIISHQWREARMSLLCAAKIHSVIHSLPTCIWLNGTQKVSAQKTLFQPCHPSLAISSNCLVAAANKSLWSLCKYSAVILAWKPPKMQPFWFRNIFIRTTHYHRFQGLHQLSNIFQRYQIRDVWTANKKRNEACGSFSFTWSLLLKAGFGFYASCFNKIHECSKSKQKEPGLPSSRDWIPHPFINFKASISV